MQDAPFFGLEELDRRIAEHVTAEHGVFVELGAYDGVTQNNTLHFEMRGWRGVLIEPVEAVCERCRVNRPLAKVFQSACVPFGEEGQVDMTSIGLMSMVRGAMGGGEREQAWIERGSGFDPSRPERVTVPARTLTAILEEAGLEAVDLLVLDVEGYEVPVLDGLDFSRFSPCWIVAEDAYDDRIEERLTREGYRAHARLSERRFTRDTLYRGPS